MLRFFRKRLLRLGRREEGAAAVEFAICLIPLLLIVGGIIDFGHLWYMESVLSHASREGARYATRYNNAKAPNTLTDPSVQDFVLKTSEENGGKGGFGLASILPSDANPQVPLPLGAPDILHTMRDLRSALGSQQISTGFF